MDYEVFLVRLPGYSRPARGISKLLRILTHGISFSSLSPNNPQVTEYSFESITNIIVSQADPTEFSFDVLDSLGTTTTYSFICNSREKLLTSLFNRLDDLNGIGTDFNVKKHSNRAGTFVDVVLRLRSTSLVKMVTAGVRHERRKASNMKKINLQDILKIETLGDDVRLVLLHMKSRIWPLSLTKDALQFAMSIQRNMKTYLNRDIEIEKTTSQALIESTTSRATTLRSNPILYEFSAIKSLEGGAGNQRERGLLITAEHLAEVSGEDIIGLHSLSDVLGVVVSDKNDTEVIVEFREWRPTQYFIQDRDSFIGSLTDVMGIAKGTQFSVRLEHFFSHTFPDKPHPLFQNECEIYMISRFMTQYIVFRDVGTLATQSAQSVWYPLLKDYACNIHVGDSLIIDARPLYAVADVLKTSLSLKPGIGYPYAVTCCIVLQRLLASRTCFDSVKNNPDFPKLLIQTMKSPNSVLSYSAAMTLRTCIKFYANDPTSLAGISGFLGSNPAAAEATNKLIVLSPDNFKVLIAQLQTHSLMNQNALHVLGILEILTLTLHLPPADSESEKHWVNNLESGLITAADVICASSRSRSAILFRTSAILLKTALVKATPNTALQLQKFSRSRCVPLVHLRHSIFSKNERARELSASLTFIMANGSSDTKLMLENVLPRGFQFLVKKKLEAFKPSEDSRARLSLRKSVESDDFRVAMAEAWLETLDLLRAGKIATPVFVWNDTKRQELLKFLKEEVESFDRARMAATGKDLEYNFHDCELVYSAHSENNELCKTIVDGIHLEILIKGADEEEPNLASHWTLEDPVKLFHGIFHSLLVCFTPLYGTSNLTEIEPRLAMDALTWIYERYPQDLESTVENLKVVETIVAMLREAIENEHHVFAFKAVYFLLLAVEHGGRPYVFRFVKAGGMPTIIPLMVVSLARCCKDAALFECDAPSVKDRSGSERVPVVGADGEVRMARVPNGRLSTREGSLLVQDGSLEAKDAILWQDDTVPEKLQLGLALDLLETLLRLSGHESVEQFPSCNACQELTRPEILFQLVQLLLRAKAPFFGRILDILGSLFKADKSTVSGLYKFGVFEILLWKLIAGDLNNDDRSPLVKFLFQIHLQQDPEGLAHAPVDSLLLVEHIPWHESYLRMFLPAGLISKLIQEGSESFRVKVEEEENSPEVIWNHEMKFLLLERLVSDLEPYVKARASDPQAVYIYMPKPAVEYPELADTIFVAPFYIHNLLDTEEFPNHHVVDPSAFHSAVLAEYQRILDLSSSSQQGNAVWKQEVPTLVQLTKAQAMLLSRYPQIPVDPEAESIVIEVATPALRVCIAQREDCPAAITSVLAYCCQIVSSIARARDRETTVSEAATNFALSILSLGTRAKADGTFPEPATGNNLEAAIGAALTVLEQTSSTRDGRHALRDDVRWRKGFWWALCSTAGEMMAAQEGMEPGQIAFSALDCLNHFSGDVEMGYRVLKQGLHLPLLLLSIPSEEAIQRSKSIPETESDMKSQALSQVACQVLRTLAVMLDQAPESDPSPRLQFERGILGNVLPLAMLTSLKNPDSGSAKFLAMAALDIDQPTAIWNQEVRQELRRKVTDRIFQRNLEQGSAGDDGEGEIQWLEEFRFESLTEELVIAGVFVKGYATGHWEHFDLPDGRAFLETLQDYLDSNRHALIPAGPEKEAAIERKREWMKSVLGQKTPQKADYPASDEDFLVAMAALGESLRYALEDNKQGMLVQVRYDLLADILSSGRSLRPAQVEVAAISQVLSQDATCQEFLLPSPLLPSLAFHLWQGMASADEEAFQLSCATLDALLELSQEMTPGVGPTNYFSSSGALLVLLALFFGVDLPPLEPGTPSVLAGTVAKRQEARVVAAQILGQLLLATAGVERRAKLVRDLAVRRSVGFLTAAAGEAGDQDGDLATGDQGGDVTDMYEILGLLDAGASLEEDEPRVVQTLHLLVPLSLLSCLARDPTSACALLDGDACSPLLVWDQAARDRCRRVIAQELDAVRATVLSGQAGTGDVLGLPAWSLASDDGRPKFLGFVPSCFAPEAPGRSLDWSLELQQKGYVRQLYLGGFFVDQLLRSPAFRLSALVEERVVREVRKMVVVAAPSHGAKARQFDFDDRRRLLLALLLLYRYRPALLGGPNLDIFLPVFDFISGGSAEERRGLTQPGLLLFHCAVSGADAADFVLSEDLLACLALVLALKVPAEFEGDPGTDPRLCALMLLLRLVRFSSKAVKLTLDSAVLGQLAGILADPSASRRVTGKAADVLSVMAADRKNGAEVLRVLNKLVPSAMHGHGAWTVPGDSIADELVDDRTIRHFLGMRFPSPWWTEMEPGTTAALPAAAVSVEAAVTFPEGSVEDFEGEGEAVFGYTLAGTARVDTKNVFVVERVPGDRGGVRVQFEVFFPRMVVGGVTREAGQVAREFKARLEEFPEEVFCGSFFGRFGAAVVEHVAVKSEA